MASYAAFQTAYSNCKSARYERVLTEAQSFYIQSIQTDNTLYTQGIVLPGSSILDPGNTMVTHNTASFQ